MGTRMRILGNVSVAPLRVVCRLVILVVFVACVPAASVAQSADAGLEVRAYGAVGLASGETARLIAVNTSSPILLPPNPCRVHLALVDAAGAAWPGSNRQPVSRTADLLPGASVALTLAFDDIRAMVTGLRASVRGAVAYPAAPSVPPNPCLGLTLSLEIFDTTTGRTLAAYSDPGPLRDVVADDNLTGVLQARFGHIGLARGLVARLNASRVGLASRSGEAPPNPCLITLEFRHRDGQLLTTRAGAPVQLQAELLAGQTTWLDLSAADVVRGNRLAELVHPLLTTRSPAVPPSPCDDVIGTVEIFDGVTGGIQSVWATPGPPDIPAPESR